MSDDKNLKRKIEETLKDRKNFELLKSKSPEEMLEELNIYYRELEFQNDELLRTQKELEKTTNHFEDLYENAPVGYVTFNDELKIISSNKIFADLTGINRYSNDTILITQYIHPESQDAFYFHFKDLLRTNKKISCQLDIIGADQPFRIPVIIDSNIFKDDNQLFIRSAFTDLTKEKEAEKKIITQNNELIKANNEKEALLGEIHHRVKNNLQIIQSILNMQKNHTDNNNTKEILSDCIERIYSMAAIHESLYQSDVIAEIDMNSYITKLTNHLEAIYVFKHYDITFLISIKKLFLPIKKALPVGLIVNELVTNSIKYAFKDVKKGEIIISLERIDNKYFLKIKDNGSGLRGDIKLDGNSNSYGLNLVSIFVSQLEAEVEIIRNKGTEFVITFSL